MALSATTPPLRQAPREVRLALWIFWFGFVASWVVHRAVLIDVLIVSPSVLVIVGVKSLVYAALSLQFLRGAHWARTAFAVLLVGDTADTALDAWLYVGTSLAIPHLPLLLGSEVAFDAFYAYAVFLLFSDAGTAWFTGLQSEYRKLRRESP